MYNSTTISKLLDFQQHLLLGTAAMIVVPGMPSPLPTSTATPKQPLPSTLHFLLELAEDITQPYSSIRSMPMAIIPDRLGTLVNQQKCAVLDPTTQPTQLYASIANTSGTANNTDDQIMDTLDTHSVASPKTTPTSNLSSRHPTSSNRYAALTQFHA